jgi:uncharacterized protein (TIGR02452 family)
MTPPLPVLLDPGQVVFLPPEDSREHGRRVRLTLDIDRDRAADLGRATVAILQEGCYLSPSGAAVDFRQALGAARRSTVSLPPDAVLPETSPVVHVPMTVVVRNETTLDAARRLFEAGGRPLALNFAAPRAPGGGFLGGARAQEETLARSSALYACIHGDPMYDHHRRGDSRLATDWAILSCDVPVFRSDDGALLESVYLCSFLTCAAPQAQALVNEQGASALPRIEEAMGRRIARVLAIARAHGFDRLVLGAWGCGAFGNNPATVAEQFRAALVGPYGGAFAEVVFAITDWSAERRFLGPFARALVA